MLDGVGRAADEGGGADLVVLGLADRRLEIVLLAHRIAARPWRILGLSNGLVRWLKRMTNCWPSGFQLTSLHVLVLLQDRDQVVRQLLDHVDLAGDQRVHLLLRVGHVDDLDPVDLGDLAAGQARGRLGARLVLRVLDVDVLLAGLGLGVRRR